MLGEEGTLHLQQLMKHIVHRRKMKKIILVLMLVLFLPSVFAVTKPVRGFVKYTDNGALSEAGVSVNVRVHSNMDEEYWCYCYAQEVFTNAQGEFVQDLGNLKYSHDCDFWVKSKYDDCGNDWVNTDQINYYLDANSHYSTYEEIGQSPIHEFADVFVEKEELSSKIVKVGSGGNEPKIVIKEENTVGIIDFNLNFSGDEEIVLLTGLENKQNNSLGGLKVIIVIKDVSGQEIDNIFSEDFELSALGTREIEIRYSADNLKGVAMLNAMLYQKDELVAVSDTVQIMVYGSDKGISLMMLGRDQSLPWGFMLLVVLMLLVLFFQIKILKRWHDEKIK